MSSFLNGKFLFSAIILMLVNFTFLTAQPEQEFPVLYKGRYRPAEAYARLWLYDVYHASTFKQADLAAFHTTSSSPLTFLLSLNALGYAEYQTAPLFWIGSAEAKHLAQLPITRNRFSYQELQEAIYRNPISSEAIVQRLILYHFLQADLESSHSSTKMELSSFFPGLWVQWQGEDAVIAAVPRGSPWPFLKKGKVVAKNVRAQAEAIIKRDKRLVEEWWTLLAALKEFEGLQRGSSAMEHAFQDRLAQLQTKALPPKEIERILEQEYPLIQRLQTAGTLFKSLPSRYKESHWFPLKALTVQVYHPSSNHLQPVGNFTSFSDEHFDAVRQAYLNLEKALLNSSQTSLIEESQRRLALALKQAYQPLAGKVFQQAHGKQLTYPSLTQLKIETLYLAYPWIPLLIMLYALGACLWIVSFRLHFPLGKLAAISVTALAILGHTALLAMRCYILGRPPVSNMFETVLYVPWVAACTSLLFPTFRRQPLVVLAACLTSMILLLVLEMTNLNQSLDQVQAVLDSQFWLMIHVLLVVGSYGIFVLGALVGHFYLGFFMTYRTEPPVMISLAQIILQTMYGGTALLIAGTILGGIWAAESWGRFWDWDPKESWAFISICFYLIWIHAYRFHRIASFGLAIGAVSGLLAITFTWYGVNYILGTGLHSYGFGSGGESYYYAFLGAEGLFLAIAFWSYVSSRILRSSPPLSQP
jgi:ABC-type transport system involved in cytochrome c biogenesis permease subunit